MRNSTISHLMSKNQYCVYVWCVMCAIIIIMLVSALSYVMPCTSCIIHHTSIHHTSYTTHHTPHTTHHTSIHHTSYIKTEKNDWGSTKDTMVESITATLSSAQRTDWYNVWCVMCDVWCVKYDVWCMMCDVWCMMCDVWYMIYGVWRVMFCQ